MRNTIAKIFGLLLLLTGVCHAQIKVNPLNQMQWPTCSAGEVYSPFSNACINPGGGSFYAGYNFAALSDSRWTFNGGWVINTTTPFQTCNGTTCTTTWTPPITAGYGLPAMGQTIEFGSTPGISCLQWSSATITAVTTTTITIDETKTLCTGSQTGSSAGTVYQNDYTVPGLVQRGSLLAGYNLFNNFAEAGQTVCGMVTQYASTAHYLSPSVTSIPGVLMIQGGANDLLGGSSISTIEGCYQSLFTAAHTDGWTILLATMPPFKTNQITCTTIGCNITARIYQAQLDSWLRGQSVNQVQFNSRPTCYATCYWDIMADDAPSVNDYFDLNMYNSDALHPYATPTADVINGALAARTGFATDNSYQGGGKVNICPDSTGAGGPAGWCVTYIGAQDAANSYLAPLGLRFNYNSNHPILVWDWYNTQMMAFYLDGASYPMIGMQSRSGIYFGGSGDGGPWDVGFAHDGSQAHQLNCGDAATGGGASANCILRYDYALGPTAPTGGAACSPNGIYAFGTNGTIWTCLSAVWTQFTGGATDPTTTLGDTIYRGSSALQRLAGPTSPNGHQFLLGSVPASSLAVAPAWWDIGANIGTYVTASSPITVTQNSNSITVACATCSTGSGGTAVNINGGSALGTLDMNGILPLACADSSGSGTAQSCNTSPTFTVFTNACVLYTTTTTNSGTALTVNVDSLGAKSVAIPGSSGWTTTLTGSIIPANKPLAMCYDGTNWNVMQTGTSASGGGGFTLVEQHTASSSSDLEFTSCFSSTYDDYQVEIVDLQLATTAHHIGLQFGNSGTWDSTSGHYSFSMTNLLIGSSGGGGTGGTTGTGINFFYNTIPSSAGVPMQMTVHIHNPLASTTNKIVTYGQGVATYSGDGNPYGFVSYGLYNTLTALNEFRIIDLDSGNLASGTVRCYGLSK
jgi:hypothetical protein